MKERIANIVYNFFVASSDFNGIPLRNISQKLNIDYENSIDIIKELVKDDIISIQSSTNPHIIGFQHYPVDSQIHILEEAKKTKEVLQSFGEFTISSEDTEFPICIYPSKNYLETNRVLTEFDNAFYTKKLALGEPHLKPVFFEIEVLDRYFNDPRFDFKFEDYSGKISCNYDENERPIVREEDEIFLKTFGLGFDENGNRLAVVYLRYLKDLTAEHQVYWKSKENSGNCKMLEEYHQNTIQGNWTFSYSIFSGFIGEQKCINDLTELIFSKPLFRKSFENENRPREFTFFFTPTLKNYNDFILLLDKMISENINKDFFEGKIEFFQFKELENGLVERQSKGTLQIFEEWLTSVFNVHSDGTVSELFKPLKKIRRERQNPAHRINENKFDKQLIEKQKKIMDEVYSVFKNLRNIFHQHPKARNFEIPNWLENGKIKTF
jgi:DNA-binding Lrp family transcriptional regulator